MQRRVLFVLPSFEIGGTAVSVKNLILLLDNTEYNVTVLPMADYGSLRYLYDDVKQISTSFILNSLSVDSWRRQKNILLKTLCAFIRVLAHNRWIKTQLLRISTFGVIPKNKFDIVIASQEGICTEFVSLIKGKGISKKIAWVRCDYGRYVKDLERDEKKIYDLFQDIVCVSDITKHKFCQVYPDFLNKCSAINNPQSSEFIESQSKLNDEDPRFIKDSVFTILSIGRYDPVKRFDRIPKIASTLISKGLNFRWYIIGGGSSNVELAVREAIKKECVEDVVIQLGIKTNPHYYIKNVNLLVSLSLSEACPRVINEAKILGTPVVCANFDTAFEYILNNENGLIGSIDDIGSLISQVMQDRNMYQYFIDNIATFSFDNDNLMKKIYKVLSW